MAASLTALVVLLGVAQAPLAQGKTMLNTGDTAPLFRLVSNTGDTVSLSSFKDSQFVILVFYPGDETPGCTKQLCELRDNYALLKTSGAAVFGMNPASRESHQQFVDKHTFPFPLLVDEGSKVADAYGCRGGMMVTRTVYVVGPDGRIVFAERGKPSPEKLIEAIAAAKK
jgi:peroxiredoxin Q/BCP